MEKKVKKNEHSNTNNPHRYEIEKKKEPTYQVIID